GPQGRGTSGGHHVTVGRAGTDITTTGSLPGAFDAAPPSTASAATTREPVAKSHGLFAREGQGVERCSSERSGALRRVSDLRGGWMPILEAGEGKVARIWELPEGDADWFFGELNVGIRDAGWALDAVHASEPDETAHRHPLLHIAYVPGASAT